MPDDVRIEELWGAGKCYDLGCSDDGWISVIVRKDGCREIHAFEAGSTETERIAPSFPRSRPKSPA